MTKSYIMHHVVYIVNVHIAKCLRGECHKNDLFQKIS
jgi:hypothetical protein